MAGQSRDIGRFSDAELIGRGGFGSVYKASDAEHGRDVAIKVLQGLGETERRRFDRERQTMGRLGSHPNIIPVHESGYTDVGEGYIVMELATGGSLRDRIDNEQTMPWREAATVAASIASAAQAAHDQGVLHRDIKPDNILIDNYGNPRLTDFGIAAVANNATATTSTTATLAHAAPELLQGQQSTKAVDIYAVGSTLYNLITGWPPFQRPGDEGVTALITRALTEPPPDLSQYGVPDVVAQVAIRALAKEPNDRQATAAQLASELTAAIAAADAGQGGAAATPSGPVSSETMVAPGLPAQPSGPAPYQNPPQQPSVPAPSTGQPGTYQGTQQQPAVAAGGYGAQAPGYGAQAPGYGAQAPGYGAQAPGYGAQAPGYGAQAPGFGAQAPGQPAAYAGQAQAPKKGRGMWLLAAGALAVIVIGATILALIIGSGDDDFPAVAEVEIGTEDDDESTTSASSTSDTSANGADSTTSTTAPTTSETTAATLSTTASTSTTTTTTTTTTTAAVDPTCPDQVLDAQTARFDIQICGDGTGALTYIGLNRSSGDGIEIPACFAGGGIFFAQNNGFLYLIDTFNLLLEVSDPNQDVVVEEDIFPPGQPDLSFPLNDC